MTSKFKVGDKVRNLSTGYVREDGAGGSVEFGVVTYVDEHDNPRVHFEGCDRPLYCYDCEVELVQEEPQMSGPNEIILYVVYNTQEVDVPEVYTDGLTALTRLGQDPDLAVYITKVI